MTADNASRLSFLHALEFTYYAMILVGLVAVGLHLICSRWDFPEGTRSHRTIKAIAYVAAACFIIVLGACTYDTLDYYKSCNRFMVGDALSIFFTIQTIILLTMAIPLVMLVAGENLTRAMNKEADDAIYLLREQIGKRPTDAPRPRPVG